MCVLVAGQLGLRGVVLECSYVRYLTLLCKATKYMPMYKYAQHVTKHMQNDTMRRKKGSRLRCIKSPSNDTPYLARYLAQTLTLLCQLGHKNLLKMRNKAPNKYKNIPQNIKKAHA